MKAPTNPLSKVIRAHAGGEGETLTLQQAAEYCGRSRSWLQKLHRAGTAPPSVKVGRERRYLKVSLDAWLAERARK